MKGLKGELFSRLVMILARDQIQSDPAFQDVIQAPGKGVPSPIGQKASQVHAFIHGIGVFEVIVRRKPSHRDIGDTKGDLQAK